MCVTLSLDDNMQGFNQLTESGQKSIICLVCLSSAVRAETSEVSETVRDELMNLCMIRMVAIVLLFLAAKKQL